MTSRAARAGRVALALVLGLLLAEGLLRLFDLPRFDACRATADYAVQDPELGFRGDPSRPVAGVVPNALGLRGPLPAQPKPADELRILFLGDSTCWGLGVDLAQSFAARATARLDAALPGAHATFVLGAFPGYSSYHSAVLLDRLLPLSPDLAVLYVGARNDGDPARYYPDADIPARQARLHAAWHRVHVLQAFEAGADLLYRRVLRRLLPASRRARAPVDAFRHNLERMASRLRQAGVPVLVVLPPISPAFEREEPQVRDYRNALVAFAEAHGIATVSVDDAFAAHAGERLFFDDHFHLAPAGHALTADALTAAIAREGLLPSVAAPPSPPSPAAPR